jgi:flagellin
MIINHNISAIFAHRSLKHNDMMLSKDIEKLSSGMRINKAGDDASGLAVSEKMRTQVAGLRRAEMNTEDGMSMIQTTEGYLQETHEIVQRIRVLAVQSANGIYTEEDRQQIQVEVSQLVDEIDRIASQAEFNKMKLSDRCIWKIEPNCKYVVSHGCKYAPKRKSIHSNYEYCSTWTSKSYGANFYFSFNSWEI